MLMAPIFVPADLLDLLDRKRSGPELERRMVTTYVLAGGGPAKAWATPDNLLSAGACWPSAMFGRPVRNVLTVLLELEVLGVVTGFEAVEGGYSVMRSKEQAA